MFLLLIASYIAMADQFLILIQALVSCNVTLCIIFLMSLQIQLYVVAIASYMYLYGMPSFV